MERWLAYLRDLLPGMLNALDSFNERVIRYPLLAFYSSTTFGCCSSSSGSAAAGIAGGFVSIWRPCGAGAV
jgi:hypothetical protein